MREQFIKPIQLTFRDNQLEAEVTHYAPYVLGKG